MDNDKVKTNQQGMVKVKKTLKVAAGDERKPSRKIKPPTADEPRRVALADNPAAAGQAWMWEEMRNHPEIKLPPTMSLRQQYAARWAHLEMHANANISPERQYRVNKRKCMDLGSTLMQYGWLDFYKKFKVQKKTFEHLVYMAEAARRDPKGNLLEGMESDEGEGDTMSARILGLLWLLRSGGVPQMIPILYDDQEAEIEKATDAILRSCPFMERPDENEQLAAEALAYEYSQSLGLPMEGAICCLDSTELHNAREDEDGVHNGEAWVACRADGFVYSGDYFEDHNTRLAVKNLRFYKATLNHSEGGLVTFNSRHSTKPISAYATIGGDADLKDYYKDEPHIAAGVPFKSKELLTISAAKSKVSAERQIEKLKRKWLLLNTWGSLSDVGYNLRRKIWLCALLINNLDYKAEFDGERKRMEEEGRLTTLAT